MAKRKVAMLPPIVMADTVTLEPEFVARIRRLIDAHTGEGGTISLEGGPYLSAPNHGLHANAGPVDEHTDGAGYTYGLIVIADDEHWLLAEGQKLPLRAGDVFRINSDLPHSTECSTVSGLIAFVAYDFFHCRYPWPHAPRKYELTTPDMRLEDYGATAVESMIARLKAEAEV